MIPFGLDDDYILCIDGLERKSEHVPMDQLLGLIEWLSEKARILILGDMKRVDPCERKRLRGFAEKVIDREFRLDEHSGEFLRSLLAKSLNMDAKFHAMVLDFFKQFGEKNLRTLLRVVSLLNALTRRISAAANEQVVRVCFALVCLDASGVDLSCISAGTEERLTKEFGIEMETLHAIFQCLVAVYKEGSEDLSNLKWFVDPHVKALELRAFRHAYFHPLCYSKDHLARQCSSALREVKNAEPYFCPDLHEMVINCYQIRDLNHAYELGFDDDTFKVRFAHSRQDVRGATGC